MKARREGGGHTEVQPNIDRSRYVTAIEIGLAAIAFAILWRPDILGQRIAIVVPPQVDATVVAVALSQSLAVILLAFIIRHTISHRIASTRWSKFLTPLTVAISFLAASFPLANWLVDDAAITFAYSENLIRGHGLVLHPDHPPEEAYSNTLWLVLLSAIRLFGVELPTAAKTLGIISGILSITLTLFALDRLGPKTKVIPITLLLSAPLVVWSNSGLEHSLQALFLFLLAIASSLPAPKMLWTQSGIVAALILLRPETPLILATVLVTHTIYIRWHEPDRILRRLRYLRLWPLLCLPGLTFGSLLLLRWVYFGDLLPNPYYAKASQAHFYGAFNLLGGGWDYLFSWFTASAVLVCTPFLFMISWRKAPLPIVMASGIIVAQFLFILFAGGDWMHCFRFVAPIIPLYALLIGYASNFIFARFSPQACWILTATIAGIIVLGSIKQYHRFLLTPTTPFQEVAKVGWTFRSLADQLAIEHPRLAHHDAGGTSYAAQLDVVDLAGLGNRSLAKRGKDPEFVADYILNRKRPHFIFGVDNFFAAATGFHLRADFKSMYVELKFPDLPWMHATLCYIRRDLVEKNVNEGLFVKEFDGAQLNRVTVTRNLMIPLSRS